MIKIRETQRMNNWVDYEMQVEGEVVGGAYVIEYDDAAYIERIDINEDRRNRGYGSILIAWISEKYGRVYAAPDNPISKRLFERIGDEHDGEYSGFDQGFGVYEIGKYRITDYNIDVIEFYVEHDPIPEP